ncbi:MAG: tetratricopeptide repeat protein [Terracidiphilus sp.]
MHSFPSLRSLLTRSGSVSVISLFLLVLWAGQSGRGQTPQSAIAETPGADRARILLVLPFDNRSGQPSLDWIREAAASLLGSRFASAGFSPMSRADRLYALDHLGLPENFQPSRASALKLAQTLDVDSIIVGSYITDGTDIIAEARVVDVSHLRMGLPVSARGEMHSLIDVFDGLAWQLTRQLGPHFTVGEDTFIAAGKGIRLDAFEQYIRGITEPDQAERLRHLKQSVALSPDFGPAWLALGREDYNGQQYEEAAAAFARVKGTSADALEAGFYRGLSLLFSGNYPQAQEAFNKVGRELPLAEVLNNEGVAVSRQGRDGSALFRQAVGADLNNPDYHFNLGVSLMRHGATNDAIVEMTQSLKLRPNDSEAQSLLKAWKTSAQSGPVPTPAAAAGDRPDPLERIVRTFDEAAFRQAAVVMDQMEAARLAALTPHDRATHLAAQAQDYLNRGLILEAERLYQSAEAADESLTEAHLGLARVRQRTGDVPGAKAEVGRALQLDPGNKAAQDLSRQLVEQPAQKQ